MKDLKYIFGLLACLLNVSFVFPQAGYDEYERLYPDCVDNFESKIYGGTYGKWPPALNLPEFPHGGDVEFIRYLYDNMEYPHVVEATDSVTGEEILAKGVVAVQIVIDRCGRVKNPQIIQSVNPEYDQEALRLMSGLPVFKPGDLYDERVKVALIVPIRFNRNVMPKDPDSGYGDYWADEEDSSSQDNYDNYSSGDKYENVQWDDSW